MDGQMPVADAFKVALKTLAQEPPKGVSLIESYSKDKKWTETMGSVIEKAWSVYMADPGHKWPHYKENYTIDHAFCCEEYSCHDLFGDDAWYPAELHWIVELENGEKPEEEMWKLAFWRARHKILCACDWNEDRKTTEARRSWYDDRRDAFSAILKKANQHVREDPDTRYYFFVSNQEHSGGDLRWRAQILTPAGEVEHAETFTLAQLTGGQ